MYKIVVLASLLASGAASAETLRNGQSVYGRPAAAVESARVIDLAKGGAIRVACGDTVTFVNAGQRFTWRFDTISHRAVPLDRIAPSGFGPVQQIAYVSRNAMERGS